ncbi:hypothetical protein GN958_ATG00062 [Phytophthora infestans]|uniref:Secreted RxLR effector peptide protein n=1 Tax=Phytophthora infestans TaxID=4787 RepID=A0A8S9VD13_PHYIN|nr:hypothetical protein GN958_ATG00062 [Phytophthora infestans]
MRVLLIIAALIPAVSGNLPMQDGDILQANLKLERLPQELVADNQNINRSLRQHEEDEIEHPREERGGLEKMDDLITKVDDAVGMTGKIDDIVGKTNKMDDVRPESAQAKLSQHYKEADELSLTTLRQLQKVEDQMKNDGALYSKLTGEGMRRKIEPFEGMKLPPKMLSAAVVWEGDNGVLISSSKTPREWLIPKGGWDEGESSVIVGSGKKGQNIQAFSTTEVTRFDDWAESGCGRIAISTKDAKILLKERPWMLDVLLKAEEKKKLVKAKGLTERDPALARFELGMTP